MVPLAAQSINGDKGIGLLYLSGIGFCLRRVVRNSPYCCVVGYGYISTK